MGSRAMALRYLNICIARDGWPTSWLDRPSKETIEEKDERAPGPFWVALRRQNLLFPAGDKPDSSVIQFVISYICRDCGSINVCMFSWTADETTHLKICCLLCYLLPSTQNHYLQIVALKTHHNRQQAQNLPTSETFYRPLHVYVFMYVCTNKKQ